MDDDVPIPFQLLKLPQKSINYVLHRMLVPDLIGFSFTSEAAKQRTKRLGLKAECVYVHITSEISILIFLQHDYIDFKFFTNEYRTPEHRLEEESIKMFIYAPVAEWKTSKFQVRKCLNHVLEIFHQTKIFSLVFETDYYENTLFDGLGGLEIEYFSMEPLHNSKSVNSQRALKQFSRAAKSIIVSRNPFPTEASKEMQRILTRNMNLVVLERPLKFTLDDLFVTNTSSLGADMQIKDVNTFLKHWIRGLDRKLQYAYFCYEEFELGLAAEKIFKNVDYQVAPANRELTFHRPENGQIDVKGGYDVRRIDGTVATIEVDPEMVRMFIRY